MNKESDDLPPPTTQRRGYWFEFGHDGRTFRMWIDENPDSLQNIIVQTGDFYEAETLEMIRQILPPAARIVDVGANIGNHAIYFDRVCGAKKVFVIEPNADVVEDLVANTAANDCQAIDLSLTGFAVGVESASGVLYISPSDDAIRNRGGVSVTVGGSAAGQSVSIRRLDDLDLGKVDFLKIDVEGNALDVLAGASGLLQRCRPAMLVEIDVPDLPEFTWWLRKAGYDVNAVVEHHPGILNLLLSAGEVVSDRSSDEVVGPTRQGAKDPVKQWAALEAEKKRTARSEETLAIAVATMRNSDARANRADVLLGQAEMRVQEAEARAAEAETRVQEAKAKAPSEWPETPTLNANEETFWRKVFFRKSGRPKKAVRRLLFRTSGRPRGVFKKYVVYPGGQPRPAFEQWMTSSRYQELRDVARRKKKSKRSALMVAETAPRAPEKLRHRSPGKHVLFIDSELPDPGRDSGSVDTINYVTWLCALGYTVHFLSTSYGRERSSDRFVLSAGAKVLSIKNEHDVSKYLRDKGFDFDMFFLSRVHSGGRLFEECRRANPGACVVFNTVDLHFVREEREANIREDKEALFRSAMLRERELYVARQSDLTIVVSSMEKEVVESAAPGTNVNVMPLFRPLPPKVKTLRNRRGVGFIGGFMHIPNVDAIDFFLAEVWPLIHASDPSIQFEIAGAGLPEKIARALPEGVIYKGQIPDLEDWLGKLRLTVAPLRYGAGAKGKVASSLVNGVPVVGTAVAFEGMGLGPDCTIAAETPEQMAQEIVRVHGDREAWSHLSQGARSFGVANLSPEAGKNRFASLLSGLPSQIADQKP